MLQFIREKAQSWIAIAIVGMLIIGLSTVVWNSYFGPDPDQPVAKVNGDKITSKEFQRAYQQQRERLQKMIGNADISRFIPDEKEFKSNVLKRLENEELILQEARAAGYRISDALLAQQIRSLQAFQTDGKFDQALYQQWLARNYMSAGQFEELLRRDLLLQQYRRAVLTTSWSSKQENQSLIQLRQQMRDVGYLTIPATNYLDKVSVSDDEAKKFYDENSARYATPEMVSIKYLELSVNNLAKLVDIDEGKLHELYEERKSEFGVPEERRTRHILIEVAGDASKEQVEAARKKAESIYKQIEDGASFEALAKKYSDDIGSSKHGGDLGYLARSDMMDPVFAKAAFALTKGQVSKPVKSAYGFHIIKLVDVKKGKTKSFDEVRPTLVKDYRRKQAEDIFLDQNETLANLTFENPDTLEVAAQELGLTVQKTPLFSRDDGPGIAANADVRSAAFSDEVLVQGLNSQVLELGNDRSIVLRMDDHQESSIRPFDEVKKQIIDELRHKHAQAMTEEAGKKILKGLSDNSDLQAIAKKDKYEWHHPKPIMRNNRQIDHKVVEQVFRMAHPEKDKILFDGLAMDNGDYTLIALYNVTNVDVGSIDKGVLDDMNKKREQYHGAIELMGAMTDMRDSAEIKEYPGNM